MQFRTPDLMLRPFVSNQPVLIANAYPLAVPLESLPSREGQRSRQKGAILHPCLCVWLMREHRFALSANSHPLTVLAAPCSKEGFTVTLSPQLAGWQNRARPRRAGRPRDGEAAVAVGQVAERTFQATGEGGPYGQRGVHVFVPFVDGDDGVDVQAQVAGAADSMVGMGWCGSVPGTPGMAVRQCVGAERADSRRSDIPALRGCPGRGSPGGRRGCRASTRCRR